MVPDREGFRPQERWSNRDTVGDCREPYWSDIVTSEQTPRGQDFGLASSGFCCVFSQQRNPSRSFVPPSGATPSALLGSCSQLLGEC